MDFLKLTVRLTLNNLNFEDIISSDTCNLESNNKTLKEKKTVYFNL